MVKGSQKSSPPARLGRPPDPAKVEAILDASWRLFLAHGVEAVTIDLIAAEAGVAKGTVYAQFPNKRALFREGVRREMAKIEAAQAVQTAAERNAALEDTLVAFGTGIMSFLASDDAVDFYSRLAGELRSDAELARLFFDAGPGRTHANLTAILAGPLASHLAIADPARAAETLLGMWQGLTNYRLMLRVDPDQVIADMPARISHSVALFMRAYAPGNR